MSALGQGHESAGLRARIRGPNFSGHGGFSAQWAPDPALRSDPRISPLYAHDLSGLPAAIVITCEHDPLRDQGEAYAARLREAGVPLIARLEQGMVHNFMLWDLVSPACSAAADWVASDLRTALAPDSGQ
jgi:acetyl esterase